MSESGDIISRKALRKEVTEKVHFMTVDGHIAYDKMLKLIDSAPTVEEPGRLKGEWICITAGNLGINTYKCSLCGHWITCTEGAMKQHKGCYCGAVMKGGAENDD